MSVTYANWAYARGKKGKDARSKIAYSVLEARRDNVQPFSLQFILDHFGDTDAQIRIIGDVDLVAQQFLMPSTWIGRVISTSLKIDNDNDFMSALTDHIGRTFDIVPSFLWIPAGRETIKNPTWHIVKVNGNYKIRNKTILNSQYVRLTLKRKRRATRLPASSLSSSSDDVSRSRSRSSSPRRRLAAPRHRSEREILKRLAAPRRRSEREISRTLSAPPPPPLAPSSPPSVRTPLRLSSNRRRCTASR